MISAREKNKTGKSTVIQFSSVAQSCPTLCNPMDCSTPGFPVQHQLLKLAQTHVRRVSDAISSSVIPFSSCPQSFPASGAGAGKSLQSCRTLPQTAAYQAPPSLGFSRPEHWSGLPFPSPLRESEVTQSCPTLRDPMDCSPPGSSIHEIFQARVLEWGAIAFSQHQSFQMSQLFPSGGQSIGASASASVLPMNTED